MQKPDMPFDALRAVGATKYFAQGAREITALEKLSVEFEPGMIAMIMGGNGSGKTTLLRALGGFVHLDSGQILFGDKPVDQMSRRSLGGLRALLSQDPASNLCLGFTVAEMKSVYLDGISKGQLTSSNLPLNLNGRQMVSELSGGQQQLLALDLVLSRNPQVLLLDEPTASLDARNAEAVRTRVRSAAAKAVIVVYVTHSLQEAVALGDRLIFIREGRVAASWSRLELAALRENDLELHSVSSEVQELAEEARLASPGRW